MNAEHEIIGKTITGIIASSANQGNVREIWMMQFSDGTYVEFVSPKAKTSLRKAARRAPPSRHAPVADEAQLALNVA